MAENPCTGRVNGVDLGQHSFACAKCNGIEDPSSYDPIPAGHGACLQGHCYDVYDSNFQKWIAERETLPHNRADFTFDQLLEVANAEPPADCGPTERLSRNRMSLQWAPQVPVRSFAHDISSVDQLGTLPHDVTPTEAVVIALSLLEDYSVDKLAVLMFMARVVHPHDILWRPVAVSLVEGPRIAVNFRVQEAGYAGGIFAVFVAPFIVMQLNHNYIEELNKDENIKKIKESSEKDLQDAKEVLQELSSSLREDWLIPVLIILYMSTSRPWTEKLERFLRIATGRKLTFSSFVREYTRVQSLTEGFLGREFLLDKFLPVVNQLFGYTRSMHAYWQLPESERLLEMAGDPDLRRSDVLATWAKHEADLGALIPAV
jgi:hypothetical protein